MDSTVAEEAQPSSITATKPKTTVDRVDVQCNGMPGTLLITTQAIVCKCPNCITTAGPQGGRVMTPTEFERHSGMQASKKWRRSIKVDLGGTGRGSSISVGRWLEQNGFIIEDKEPPRASASGTAKGSSSHRHRPPVESDYTDEEDQGAFHRASFPRFPLPNQHNLFPGLMPHHGMMLPPQGLNPFLMSPLSGMFGGGVPFHPTFGSRDRGMNVSRRSHQHSEEGEGVEESNRRQVKNGSGLRPQSGPRGGQLLGKHSETANQQGKGPDKELEDELLTAAGALELLRSASETRGTSKEASRQPARKRGQLTDDETEDEDEGKEAGSGPRGSRDRQGGSGGSKKQFKATPQARGSNQQSGSEGSDDLGVSGGGNLSGIKHGSWDSNKKLNRRGVHVGRGQGLPYGYPYPPGFSYDPFVAALAQQQQQQQILAAAVAMGFPHGGGGRVPTRNQNYQRHAAAAVPVPQESKATGARPSVSPATPKGTEEGQVTPEEEGAGNVDGDEEEEDTPLPAHVMSLSGSNSINEALDVAASAFAQQHGNFGLAGFASNSIQQALMAQQLLIHHQLLAAAGGHMRGTQGGGPNAMMIAAAREMLAATARNARGLGHAGKERGLQTKSSRSE